MGLKDTSPVPKKDSMGMDYIPVYDEEPQASGGVTLSPQKIQTLGVRTERAIRRPLAQDILAAATVAIAESRQQSVAPRFDGWIDRLYITSTGAAVRAGHTLATAHSPTLTAAEEEYLLAENAGAAGEANATAYASPMRDLAQAALQRLRNAGVAEAEIGRLQRSKKASQSIAITAPIDGVAIEKIAVAGMRFVAGDVLFRLVDLSRVWAQAEVPEQDLPRLSIGQSASFETAAWPGRRFNGRVSFIGASVAASTRSTQARVELVNTDAALRPGMFGRLTLGSTEHDVLRLSVPSSAVIDSGRRQIVLLAQPGGRFEPRTVQLGLRSGQYVEILTGLTEGELVVSSGMELPAVPVPLPDGH
jgi:Cu(I)/Ag(I) efflux system membrane fusion protein